MKPPCAIVLTELGHHGSPCATISEGPPVKVFGGGDLL